MKTLPITSLLVTATVLCTTAVSAQNVPIDFEDTGNGANWTWTVFENDGNPPLEIIDNPDMSGINTSCTVAKFTALQTGNPWAGCESMHGADLGSFTLDANTSTINIMVWKPVISNVGVKLVTPTNAAMVELLIPNTVVNEWELLTFDFSSYIGQFPYDVESVDQVVIFPDFNTNGRTQDNICYFDNVWGVDSVTAACNLSVPETDLANFSVFPNPSEDNITVQSASVIQAVKVYNTLGSVVFETEVLSNTVSLDIAEFESGVYFIEAKIEGQVSLQRLVKE
ncbi:T9SS type A sorting domain-containing protein [Crocinitomicaceae bacterium]|nr:T9SS type A sorting domain-containing protein [Crocinitomicaceae bacterium]